MATGRPPGRPRKNADEETQDLNDPLETVMMADREGIADQFASILEGLEGIDQGNIKGILYRVPPGQGKFEYIREVYPPFNITVIMDDLKEAYGGGDYQLRLFVGGRIKKNVNFSIVKEKPGSALTSDRRSDNTMDFMQLILSQQNQSRSDMQAMMTMMMQTQAQSADRQAAAQAAASQQMMQMMTVLLPVLAGGKEKTSELLASFATLQNMGKPEGDNFTKMLEQAKLMKEVFGGDGASSAAEGAGELLGEGLKLAGPLLGSLAKSFTDRKPQQTTVREIPQDIYTPGGPVLMHAPGAALETPVVPDAAGTAPILESGAQSRFPILDLIRDDVLFMFKRGHSPETAAEVAFDSIEKASLDEAAIFEVVTAFQSSADWIADLAGEGIDLRSNPLWANAFLSHLVQLYADASGDLENSAGGERGLSDNDADGRSSEAGEPNAIN